MSSAAPDPNAPGTNPSPTPDPETPPAPPAEPIAPLTPETPLTPAGWKAGLEPGTGGHEILGKYEDSPAGLQAMAAQHVHDQTGMRRRGVLKPDWEDSADVHRYHVELGMPETAAEYDFEGITIPEGGGDSNSEAALRMIALLHEKGLSNHQAKGVIQGFFNEASGVIKKQYDTAVERRQEAEETLKQEWGGSYAARLDIANRAMAASGQEGQVNQVLLDTMMADGGTVAANSNLIKAFYRLGSRMSEGKMLGNKGGAGPQPMDPGQAKNALLSFERDNGKELTDRNTPPDVHANLMSQREALFRAAYPEETPQ